MAKLIDIPENEEDSYNLAMSAIYHLIKATLPTHNLEQGYRTMPPSTGLVVYIDQESGGGFHDNGLGNKPIYHEMDEDGVTTEVFQETCVCRLRTVNGNAYLDLKKIKSAIEQPEIHYRFFGGNGVVGITSIGRVRKTPISVNFSRNEDSAVMLITLTYLHKVVNGDGFPIEKVIFDATTSTAFVGGESITDEVTIDPSS